jgi:hypothetical protein
MTTSYTVTREGEPDSDLLHLWACPVGPAGPAPLIPVEGVVCRFDAQRAGPPTEIWIDLNEVDAQILEDVLGPAGAQLLHPDPAPHLDVIDQELGWLEAGSRLAALELARRVPSRRRVDALWALEAALLRAALADFGLERPELLDDEVEAMLPALGAARSAGLDDPILALAVALAHEFADPNAEAFGYIPPDDGSYRGEWPEVAAALRQLRPARLDRKLVTMGDDDWSLHDLLWLWLPNDFFPDGDFIGLATMEQWRAGLRKRLKITLARPEGISVPLFVRLVTASDSDPTVVAVDAMFLDETGTHYVATLDRPSGLVDDRLRIEVLEKLHTPLDDDATFSQQCGRQAALLALRSDRAGDSHGASRQWYLSQAYHRTAGDENAADEAGKRARLVDDDGDRAGRHGRFVGESGLADDLGPDLDRDHGMQGDED